MSLIARTWSERQVILDNRGQICRNTVELLESQLFWETVKRFLAELRARQSPLLELLAPLGAQNDTAQVQALVTALRELGRMPLARVHESFPALAPLLNQPELLHQFAEELYDYWRRFDRFLVCYSEEGGGEELDQRPYRTFNERMERLTHLVRAAYRDICENITGTHPRIYRQVPAGVQVGVIVTGKTWPCPGAPYRVLANIPFIRQLMLRPPLVIDPPMNKRTGTFQLVGDNPLVGLDIDPAEWLCYPARVGPLTVFIYFHQMFFGLGCSLANLFELAEDEDIERGPDAIYLYGAPAEAMARFGELPTVFYDDEAVGLFVGAVPGEDRFGYFGYLKKMVLTLHNVIVMKKLGRLPFHGALTRIQLRDGTKATLLIWGDTGAGKSETLEALRILGDEHIRELKVIADDMGSLEIAPDGKLVGYGTEIGAFLRLDDLQPGYALRQIDRAIIMSPQKVNARTVLPITTLAEILKGYAIDYLLYANNYEEITSAKPIVEPFASPEEALGVFRAGYAMAKGTTTAVGLVQSYFANPFGPPQYRDLHEELAARYFEAAFRAGVYVGQLRTRLGIPGYERKGPEAAGRELLKLLAERGSGKCMPGKVSAAQAAQADSPDRAAPAGSGRLEHKLTRETVSPDLVD